MFRLCVSNALKTIQKCSQQHIHITPIVCGEPMRKKKRLDPKIIAARLDRKKRKIEKQIRRLQKNARQMKPIDEVEIPRVLSKPEHRRYKVNDIFLDSFDVMLIKKIILF